MMEQEQETKSLPDTGAVISALTLVMYNDLGCDIEPVSVLDGKEYSFNPNTLDLFKGFLESMCNKFGMAEVLKEYIEVGGDSTDRKDTE